MSVNGLDSPAVVEAYQNTLADPGGWLLLEYISRDELGILKRGKGGWQELRTALEESKSKSPLYGFFLYRRRKLVLKFIAPETSRLLQVRTTVHFPAITDHFSPHDVTLSASSPSDLSDAALSATCSLHTETSLPSSEGSLRRRNMAEITETVEEPQSSNPEVASILNRLKANREALAKEQTTAPSRTPAVEAIAGPESILARLKANREALAKQEAEGRLDEATADVDGGLPDSSYFGSGVSPTVSEARRSGTVSPVFSTLPFDPYPERGSMSISRKFADDLQEVLNAPSVGDKKSSKRELREARAQKKPATVHNARAESPHLYPRKPRKTGDNIRADLFDARRNANNVRADIFDPRKNGENMRGVVEPGGSLYESRPGTSDSKYSFLSWKPKVKLNPRPAPEDVLKRPTTDSATRQKLPSGMRLALHRAESTPKLPKAAKSPKPATPGDIVEDKQLPGSSKMVDDVPDVPKVPKVPNVPRSKWATKPTEAPAFTFPTNGEAAPSPPQNADMVEKELPSVPEPSSPEKRPETATTALATQSSQSSIKKAAAGPEKQRLMKALQQRNMQLSKPNAATETDSGTVEIQPDVPTVENLAGDMPKADSGVELEGSENKLGPARQIVPTEEFAQAQGGTEESPALEQREAPKEMPGEKKPVQTEDARKSHLAQRMSKRLKPPISKIDTSPSVGEDSDGFESDDSLIKELKQAKVEEARRVSIPGLEKIESASTPVSPIYSGGDGKPIVASAKPIVYRNGSVSSVGVVSPPPVASSQTHAPSTTASVDKSAPTKRNNAASGLSRRIRALAELSHNENSQSSGYGQTGSSSNFFSSKKSATQGTSQSGSVAGASVSQSIQNISSRPPGSSHSMQRSLNTDAGSQSVSITARIVQPSGTNGDERLPSRGGTSADFQQSEVTVQRDTDQHIRSPSKASFFRIERPSSRPESRESAASARTKGSSDHGFSFLGFHRDSETKSTTRSRRSPSIATLETVEEDVEEKKKPKKSIFKRMSGFAAAATRRSPPGSSSSTAGRDGTVKGAQLPGSQMAKSGVAIGDLNVQFPDTLLWKRRWVEIDTAGFLTLSSTNANERLRLPPRRYHLTELKPPVLATQDGQELPFSILIDLSSGGTVQLACEDPISQGQVLRRLSDCHHAWTHYGS